MPTILEQTQVECYKRDGYVCPVRVMGEEDAAGFRVRLEALAVLGDEADHTALYKYIEKIAEESDAGARAS